MELSQLRQELQKQLTKPMQPSLHYRLENWMHSVEDLPTLIQWKLKDRIIGNVRPSSRTALRLQLTWSNYKLA